MATSRTKLIVVCGATATGKSSLAVEMARELANKHGISCEIISADSRQIYRGLDLGTGKITRREMKGIPHHMLDIADPKRRFSVEQFKKLAQKNISEIAGRGHTPIICGGTGFYIQAVVDDLLLPNVPPNKELRKKLEKKTVTELFEILKKLDPERAADIDAKNPRRLVRAIEIAKAIGKVPKSTLPQKTDHLYAPLFIGVTVPDEQLKKKIHVRLISRIKKGMINEVRELHEETSASLSWKRMNELGLEYRYISLHIQGKAPCRSSKEMISKLNTEIWHYAKRQKTWFKRDTRVNWLAPDQVKKAVSLTKDFWEK